MRTIDFNRETLILEAKTTGCTVEASINGIPAFHCGLGASFYQSMPVNQFATPGDNTIELLVNPGDTPASRMLTGSADKPASGAQPGPTAELDSVLVRHPSFMWPDYSKSRAVPPGAGAADPLPEMSATLRLVVYQKGQTPFEDEGESLMMINWRHKPWQSYPEELSTTRALGPLLGEWYWQQAARLELSDDLRAEALAFLEVLADVLERADMKMLQTLTALHAEELRRAYKVNVRDSFARLENYLNMRKAEEDWMIYTPREDEISWRVCAGGRLLACELEDWRPALRSSFSEKYNVYSYPVFLGRLHPGGSLVILR